MYVLSTGCQWRAVPKDLPPRSTLYDYFDLWTWDGTLDRLHHALYVRCREQAGREASPTAAIIDSQSVKAGEKRMARPFGKRLLGIWHEQSAKTYPASGLTPWAKMEIRALWFS